MSSLPRIDLRETNISATAVLNFAKVLEQNHGHSFMLIKNGKVVAEA
jgi:hypothetical protein